MPTENLTINISRGAAATGTWLNLEQEHITEVMQEANLADLMQMYSYARSGLSARNYLKQDCPVLITGDNTATVTLVIYVWPFALDLAYSLDAGIGILSAPQRVDLHREFDLVVPMADTADIGFLFDGLATWQTPSIKSSGAVIPRPDLNIVDGRVDLSAEVFGVLRMVGVAHGYRHTATIEINDTDANRISNLQESIIASWVDADGKTQTATLDLNIPKCVADALAACPDDGSWMTIGTITESPSKIPVVYYSTCTGNVIMIRYE